MDNAKFFYQNKLQFTPHNYFNWYHLKDEELNQLNALTIQTAHGWEYIKGAFFHQI